MWYPVGSRKSRYYPSETLERAKNILNLAAVKSRVRLHKIEGVEWWIKTSFALVSLIPNISIFYFTVEKRYKLVSYFSSSAGMCDGTEKESRWWLLITDTHKASQHTALEITIFAN